MTIVPIFCGNIKNGKLIIQNQDRFDFYLLSLGEKEVMVTVRIPIKNRTHRQNRWYWSCVVGIPAEHFGYFPDEMHEAYKFMFLRREEQGKPLTVRSTTSLDTIEFTNYVEQCRHWAVEQGLVIPDPDIVELS